MTAPKEIPVARIRELLRYDPESGHLVWAKSRSNVRAGSLAGSIRGDGYLDVRIDRKLYRAHRIAYALTHGAIPDGWEVDHINGCRSDNRLSNLRLVTSAENKQNTVHMRPDNTSGTVGVAYDASRNKFAAYIGSEGRLVNLGRFDTIEEAKQARFDAEARYHPLAPKTRVAKG